MRRYLIGQDDDGRWSLTFHRATASGLLHDACRRHVYWAPPLQQCPIVAPKYEKVASAFAWLVLRAADWNAVQPAQQ